MPCKIVRWAREWRPTIRNNPAATNPATNAWTAVYSKFQNIANIETYGADLEINYKMRIAERPVNLRLLTAYQPHAIYLSPGSRIDQGGVAFGGTGLYSGARVRVTGFVNAELTDAFSVNLMLRYRDSLKLEGDESLPEDRRVWASKMPSFTTTNLTLAYKLLFMERTNAEVYFNVSNLFDAKAPGGSSIGNSVRPGLRDSHVTSDDIVGRAYNSGLQAQDVTGLSKSSDRKLGRGSNRSSFPSFLGFWKSQRTLRIQRTTGPALDDDQRNGTLAMAS